MDQDIRKLGETLARNQRGKLLRFAPALLIGGAVIVWMLSKGDEPAVAWAGLLFIGAGLLAFPLMFVRSLRRTSYVTGPFAARRIPIDILIILVIALMMGGAGLFMAWRLGLTYKGVLVGLCGVIGVLLGLSKIPELFTRGPILTIDEAGYFDRRMLRAPVPWDRVQGLQQLVMRGQPLFQLIVSGQDANLKIVAKVSNAMGFAGLSLNPHGLDCTWADQLLAIHHFCPRAFVDQPEEDIA
jgi:hypothetical protein